MRKYLGGFAFGLAILGILAYICWLNFEVENYEKWVPPGPEARSNSYLALDRWLNRTGHPVRLADSGDYEALEAAVEQTIFIQATLFDWSSEAVDFLLSWVENGGILVLAFDYAGLLDDEYPAELLERLEIRAARSSQNYHYAGSEPRLDRYIVFEVPAENQDALVIKDNEGLIRLVQVRKGKGKITVTGDIWFMHNSYIKEPPNARLAWNLLAERPASPAGEPGVFFIRDFRDWRRRGETDLFGEIFKRGNLFAPLVSAALLIVVGFWAALSVFGVVREDGAKPGKPLRERFLAEGRFLKRFGALNSYLAAYQGEIKRKLLKSEGLQDENEIILRAAELWNEAGGTGGMDSTDSIDTIKSTESIKTISQAFSQSPVGIGAFRKKVLLLKSILERL
jgi:hypothetical protein